MNGDSNVVIFVPCVQSTSSATITQGGSSPRWSGRNFYPSDDNGHLIQSHHNVTIRRSGGAHVSLVNPSLHASNSFLMGCSKRCGLRQEKGGGIGTREPPDLPHEKTNNPIGAGSAIGSNMRGHTMRCTVHPAFAASEKVLHDEVILEPHSKGILGPIFFFLWEKKHLKVISTLKIA